MTTPTPPGNGQPGLGQILEVTGAPPFGLARLPFDLFIDLMSAYLALGSKAQDAVHVVRAIGCDIRLRAHYRRAAYAEVLGWFQQGKSPDEMVHELTDYCDPAGCRARWEAAVHPDDDGPAGLPIEDVEETEAERSQWARFDAALERAADREEEDERLRQRDGYPFAGEVAL